MGNGRAYFFLVLVMFGWGINVPIVKYLTTSASPVLMTSIRILIASIVVFSILFSIGQVRKLHKTEWLFVIGGSLLNVVIHHLTLSVGMTYTTSTNASLVLGCGPVLTAVIGMLMLKNLPSKMQWFGFILGMLGVIIAIVFTGGQIHEISIGDILIFIAILSQVFSFVVIAKAAKSMDARLLTGYMFLFGSLMLAIIGLMINPQSFATIPLDMKFWCFLILSGAGATALGHMVYNSAIVKVGTAKSSIFINLSTIIAVLSSALMMGDRLTIVHAISLILIILGVLFGSGAVEVYLSKRKLNSSVTIESES